LLIGDGGRISGIKMRDDDGISVLNARSVVLGCGSPGQHIGDDRTPIFCRQRANRLRKGGSLIGRAL
jgi:hypothetical protein